MIYELDQRLKNVTVEILRDSAGDVSIGWYMQDNTEDITEENPMTKANQTLIRAESIDGEIVGSTMRGNPIDLIALLSTLVYIYLAENPKSRKLMRLAMREAFLETRPRLGDVIADKVKQTLKGHTE